MKLAAALLLIAATGFDIQGCWGAQVDVEKKIQTVLPGQNATFMCRVAVPLQYCRVEIPGLKTLNLNRGISNADVSYYGQGLDAGQCGFVIHRAEDRNNGDVKCTLGIASEAQESVGTMSLIVARSPKAPELDLSQGTDHLVVYKVDDTIQASCIVRDGRPVANISWFLDNEPIDNSELSMPTVIDLAKENLQSKIQNLTRRLRASDNGKYLRCVAYHDGYPGGISETKRQLDIKYGPLPQRQPIEEFGYEIGKVGVINVTVEANPKPQIEWSVDGQKIREGSHDNTGSMEAEVARDLGNGRYLVSLKIARISKLDTDKEYILTAYNDMGSQDYRVKISTNPEPKGFEFGVASVIGIVVAILFIILVVSIVIFAKVTGRWCFSGNPDTRYLAESSDTESAEVRPKESKRQLSAIKLGFFKKNKDKVAAGEEPGAQNAQNTLKPETDAISAPEKTKEKEGLVYAELDLVSPSPNSPVLKPVVKNDDEKTEYAEIVYTPMDEENNEEDSNEKNEK
ncbi:fasciclin-3 isoform X2 [Cylas formicarius]|uniref:fasciclin-3 isoform X2 n=1 Tax=Cylas formicarius TaxID=197179 RepID=UPI0029587E0D|nr:fasciclin-3 isoform X2 [Cylas formicarius]